MKTKKRISTTVTKFYIESIDWLLSEGIYLTRGEVVLEALRDLFRRYELVPSVEEDED